MLSLFGGIEASRRALDLLGVQATRHISVELDKMARRAAAEVYPDVIHFNDILEFTRGVLHNAVAGLDVTFVLVCSGSPCQGVSGANATKMGFDDPRTKLFMSRPGLSRTCTLKSTKFN